ncbi:MAG TPA: hypothetical protein VNX28_04265 [Gemmataceae bacterium]|nr:hypothetical protein [Gemmataceae bacterium]
MADKIKFKVSIKELSFEYEGTREVGQAIQAGLSRSLAGLVDTQRTAMLPVPTLSVHDHVNGNGHESNSSVIDQPGEKSKKPRKSSGVSLIGLLRDLKTEKFFGEPRSLEMLRDKLKTKGHTFRDSTISARLLDLTKKNGNRSAHSREKTRSCRRWEFVAWRNGRIGVPWMQTAG